VTRVGSDERSEDERREERVDELDDELEDELDDDELALGGEARSDEDDALDEDDVASERSGDRADELDDDSVLAAMSSDKRRGFARVVSSLFFLALGVVLGVRHREALGSWFRGEIDLAGDAVFEPRHPESPERLAAIDWRAVHGRLLPGWMIAQSRSIEGFASQSHLEAHRRFAELRYAVGPDRNLVELLDELERHLREDPVGRARRIDYLLWAYNEYLDRNEVPWRLEASLTLRRDRRRRHDALFMTRSYEVLGDMQTAEGHRLRLLRRADLTNIDEGILGHASDRRTGALVMMGQVMQFAVHQVWPMLHAGLDVRLSADQRGLAPHVRREALAAFSPDLLLLLNETAVDQQALIEVADAIHARESCGNTFKIWGLPWNGLAPPDKLALVEALGRSQGRECPEVTLTEAARLLGASERLGGEEELALAVEELVTWVARAVSVHELRHVADQRDPACTGCPEGMSGTAKDELSAYLESFATEGVGYVALSQACSILPDREDVSIAPHAQALAVALERILPEGCAGPIPDDLYERAAAAEAELFGPRERIPLPADYPERVTLIDAL